jgi:hypothetical protein
VKPYFDAVPKQHKRPAKASCFFAPKTPPRLQIEEALEETPVGFTQQGKLLLEQDPGILHLKSTILFFITNWVKKAHSAHTLPSIDSAP